MKRARVLRIGGENGPVAHERLAQLALFVQYVGAFEFGGNGHVLRAAKIGV